MGSPAICRLTICMALAAAGPALADAQAIIRELMHAESQRLAGVQTLIVDKTVLGIRMQEKFETAQVEASDGSRLTVLRRLSPGEQISRANAGVDARSMADAAGAPLEVMELAREFEVVGSEMVAGFEARHLRADGLARTQTVNGDRFTLHSADLWVDVERSVVLRMRFEGEMESSGEKQPVVVERADRDHRSVAGSDLLEPFHQVFTLQGLMTEAQQAEMREASAQLEELELRMAEMPPSQQEMLRRQMGPQMQTLRTLAAGGDLEVDTRVHEIRVNDPDFGTYVGGPVLTGPGPVMNGPGMTASNASQETPASPQPDPQPAGPTLAEQQRCLEERAAAARQAEQKKRGIGRLFGAVERVAARAQNFRVLQAIDDAAAADATAADLAAAAEDLGLTESDIEACSRY